MHIGKEVKEALKRKRMSHQELAELIGVSRYNISYTLQNHDTYCHRLAKISKATGVNFLEKLQEYYGLSSKNATAGGGNNQQRSSESEVERLKREKMEILEVVNNHTNSLGVLLKQYKEWD